MPVPPDRDAPVPAGTLRSPGTHGSDPTDGGPPEGDHAGPVAEYIRRRALPLLFAAWFVAYLNRFNVSFAALQMNEELGLSSAAFGFGAGVFFLGYGLFEIPSNLILRRVGARRWIGRIMVGVGIASIAMAATAGPASFYTLRLLLGIAEAGLFPGMAYYLSQWLTPRGRAAAFGVLGSAAMISGIAGGPIAAALLSLDGVWGLSGWQWLFVLEGVPAIVMGAGIWRYLPDDPHAVRRLSPGERQWAAANMATAQQSSGRTTLQDLAEVLTHSRYVLFATAFFLAGAAGASVRLFRPSILRDMAQLSDTWAAILTAIPGVVGAVVIVYVGRRSTRLDERRWHTAVPWTIGAISIALMGVVYGLPGALLVSSLASVGAAGQPPLFGSVSAVTQSSLTAIGIAFVSSAGAIGSFVGPYVVGYVMDLAGLAAACAVAGASIAMSACLALVAREPRREEAAAPRPAVAT